MLTKGMELGSREHINQCIAFTGEVAEKVASLYMKKLDIDQLQLIIS
ncbi:hypothetical protein [Clostridium sp. UBA6640]|nr:hypothetical protein [Clostridium sp. UBA6640]